MSVEVSLCGDLGLLCSAHNLKVPGSNPYESVLFLQSICFCFRVSWCKSVWDVMGGFLKGFRFKDVSCRVWRNLELWDVMQRAFLV